MSVPVKIEGANSKIRAKVTKYGQLVTSPLAYSAPMQANLVTPDIAYNFIEPSAGEAIVITDVIASAAKSVSNTTPANIQIYQSNGINSLEIVDGILSPQLTGASNFVATGLNMLVPEGRWVNATTDDATILITIMYYKVPKAQV